eukprot:GHVN01048739.1.p1 GENE.GHVN01048739.1~~GHVN01048739.1.p1  ORF type:complete len:293 (+),score=54.22 GHVN01048739.1:51-929(+)
MSPIGPSQFRPPDCSICTERLLNSMTNLTTCGHIFHTDCILKWFARAVEKNGKRSRRERDEVVQAECPLCRKKFSQQCLVELKMQIEEVTGNTLSSPTHLPVGEGGLSPTSVRKLTSRLQERELELARAKAQNSDIREKLLQAETKVHQLEEDHTESEVLRSELEEMKVKRESWRNRAKNSEKKVEELENAFTQLKSEVNSDRRAVLAAKYWDRPFDEEALKELKDEFETSNSGQRFKMLQRLTNMVEHCRKDVDTLEVKVKKEMKNHSVALRTAEKSKTYLANCGASSKTG